MLERLHHFVFGIPSLQSVTAVDEQQLNNVVYHYYGNDTNVKRYLQKFFTLSILLNEGNFNKSFNERYSDYVGMFAEDRPFQVSSDVELFIKTLFDGINPRTIDRAVEKAMLVHNMLNGSKMNSTKATMCIELMFSLFSLHGTISEVCQKYLIKGIYAPTIASGVSGTPKDTTFSNLINGIAGFQNKMFGSSWNITIRTDNLWTIVWYSIIINSKVETSINYTFDSGYLPSGRIDEELKELFEYSKAFASKSFIL